MGLQTTFAPEDATDAIYIDVAYGSRSERREGKLSTSFGLWDNEANT